MNIRDRLREFKKRRYKVVAVHDPEDPETIIACRIQSITERERAEVHGMLNNGHAGYLNALLIAAACVDEDGDRVYTFEDIDIQEILELDSGVAAALADEVAKFVMPSMDLDDTVKNSETTTTDDSPSD